MTLDMSRGKRKSMNSAGELPLTAYRRSWHFVKDDTGWEGDTTVQDAREMMQREMTAAEWSRVRAHILTSTGDAALLWSFFCVLKTEDMEMLRLALRRVYQHLGYPRSRELFQELKLDPRTRAFIEISGERP